MKNFKRMVVCVLTAICLYALIFPVPIRIALECVENTAKGRTIQLEGRYDWYLLKEDQFVADAVLEAGESSWRIQAVIDGKDQPLFVWSEDEGYLNNGMIKATTWLREIQFEFVDQRGEKLCFVRK